MCLAAGEVSKEHTKSKKPLHRAAREALLRLIPVTRYASPACLSRRRSDADSSEWDVTVRTLSRTLTTRKLPAPPHDARQQALARSLQCPASVTRRKIPETSEIRRLATSGSALPHDAAISPWGGKTPAGDGALGSPADDYVRSTTLVVFRGTHVDLAFDALRVRQLHRSKEWRGRKPVALYDALGVDCDADDEAERIVVLETHDDREVPVLTEGAFSIQTVSSDSVAPPVGEDDCVIGIIPGPHDTWVLEPDRIVELASWVGPLPS